MVVLFIAGLSVLKLIKKRSDKMQKKYRLIVLFSYCLLMMTLLSGCGGSEKTLEEMKIDLNASGLVTEYAYVEEDIYEVTELELIKRNTQEEYEDDVYVSFQMKNDECMISGNLELIYNYYSTGGWILDEIYPTSDFVFTPLVGQTEFWAEEDLFYQGYNTYKLKEHNTDLENQIDYFTYDVSCEGEIYSIDGCVNMIYLYDNSTGEWVFDGIQNDGCNLIWNATGTYARQQSHIVSMYYFDSVENAILYGKSFYIFLFNDASECWADEIWTIDLSTKTLSNGVNVLCFDQNGIYTQYGDAYEKISDGCADPKAYVESLGGGYNGPDIGGAPLIKK